MLAAVGQRLLNVKMKKSLVSGASHDIINAVMLTSPSSLLSPLLNDTLNDSFYRGTEGARLLAGLR
jgi:hypothetical protein